MPSKIDPTTMMPVPGTGWRVKPVVVNPPRRVLGGISWGADYRWEVETSDGITHAFENAAAADLFYRRFLREHGEIK